MKNRFLFLALTLCALSSIAYGDIQSPAGHRFTWSRKLSRGIGNVLFGWFEYPSTWSKTNRSEGPIAAASDFIVEGTKRTFVRAGYGLYEIATFPVPSWKRTYRPPYHHKATVDGWWGYTEFAPEIGFRSEVPYSTSYNQGW